MQLTNNIFTSIKVAIGNVEPSATIVLFGSRANNTANEESDWDILVLTKQVATRQLKRRIQDAVFPLSVQIGAFINLLLVEENDWLENPSYYPLHQTITSNTIDAWITKKHLLNKKIAKAKSLLAEVDVLMTNKFYTTTINRLYYASFHATKALLLTKDIIAKTHSGVIAMLHQQFVQQGFFDNNQAAFFSRLMQERIEDDYNDFIILDGAAVLEFLVPTKDYIAYIESLILL